MGKSLVSCFFLTRAVHAYTKTYYTKNDKFDIEQTFNTQFEAAHTLLKAR